MIVRATPDPYDATLFVLDYGPDDQWRIGRRQGGAWEHHVRVFADRATAEREFLKTAVLYARLARLRADAECVEADWS